MAQNMLSLVTANQKLRNPVFISIPVIPLLENVSDLGGLLGARPVFQVTDDVLDAVALKYGHYFTQMFSHTNVIRSLILFISDIRVCTSFNQNFSQFLPAHSSSNMKGSITVLKYCA